MPTSIQTEVGQLLTGFLMSDCFDTEQGVSIFWKFLSDMWIEASDGNLTAVAFESSSRGIAKGEFWFIMPCFLVCQY